MAKVKATIRENNERGARRAIFEDLFNDFNRSRFTVYKMNFIRGLFFGFGSVLGGTVVIAFLVWFLNLTGALVPGLAQFINDIVHVIQQK